MGFPTFEGEGQRRRVVRVAATSEHTGRWDAHTESHSGPSSRGTSVRKSYVLNAKLYYLKSDNKNNLYNAMLYGEELRLGHHTNHT